MAKGLFLLDFDPSALETYSRSPTVLFTSLSDSVFHIPFDGKEVIKLLWHYRLGHLTFPCLQKVQTTNSKIKLKVPGDTFCSICPWPK